MAGALSGVRVLDFTEYIAGPFAGQTLADMGAEVTKIEPPHGDFWRLTNPIAPNESRGFIGVNRGKRSVAIDLKTPEGQAIVHRAAATADVVLAGYRGGVAERLGVDYATLSKLNPRLIYAESTAFGSEGPYSYKAGFDLVAQAMTGIIAFESQSSPRPRSITTGAITDFVSGTFMAYAVVCALYQREQTGRGQRIESSLFAAGLTFQYRPMLSVEVMDAEPRAELLEQIAAGKGQGKFVEDVMHEVQAAGYVARGQPAVSTNPYYGIYRTRDSHMVVACLNNRLRRRAAAVLGIDDPRVVTNEFETASLTLQEREALNQRMRDVFETKTTDEWCKAFDAEGVPCGPVRLGEELYDDPHVRSQQLILELDHPVVGPVKTPNLPIRLSDAEVGAKTAAPALGQHTVTFLHELGYGDDEIERLRTSGIVRAWE